MLVLNDNGTFTRLISREAEMKIMENIRGERKGEKKGEMKEKRNIAQKLLKENMPIEKIKEITGLSIKEINKLQK